MSWISLLALLKGRSDREYALNEPVVELVCPLSSRPTSCQRRENALDDSFLSPASVLRDGVMDSRSGAGIPRPCLKDTENVPRRQPSK